ncbi:MAG: DUF5647 family protein [Thermomicrobiales bacterium]
MARTITAPAETVDAASDDVVEKNIALTFDFLRAQITDPALVDEIPDGATLILLPIEAPGMIEANIEIGLASLRRGENVYFRYVPEAPARSRR